MTVNVHRLALSVLAMLLSAGCAATPPPASSSSSTGTGRPAPSSYEEVAESLCAAWRALDTAVGNPDTGEGSQLSDSLDASAERRDVASAEHAAALVIAELEAARQHAAHAGRWEPAAEVASQMDRLLLAFEAMITAKVEEARGTAGADSQRALEQAGGMEAWAGTLQAIQELVAQRPDGPPRQCADVPIGF